MRKLNKKTGFTLAELLIVVAIIAILVAIGIPAFSTAMERSRETVDLSNIRGAYAEFIAGSLGGRADTGYYQVDIKQRDPKTWVVDSAGFLTNVVNERMPAEKDSGIGATVVAPAAAKNQAALKTGQMWVRFSFVDPDDTTKLMKSPVVSFMELSLKGKPLTDDKSEDTAADDKQPALPTSVKADTATTKDDGNIVDFYDEHEVTPATKKTYVGHWYLTKEQTEATTPGTP